MQTQIFVRGLTLSLLTGLAACSPIEPRSSQASPVLEPEAKVLSDRQSTPSDDQARIKEQIETDSALAGVRKATAEAELRTDIRAQLKEERSRAVAQKLAPQETLSMSPPRPASRVMVTRPPVHFSPQTADRENYASLTPNNVHRVIDDPVSTFSVDVDTGSYANVRRFLTQGRLPPQDAVRVEELINNFDYAYSAPRDSSRPFSVATELAPTPWNNKTHLLQVGIQGWKPTVKPVGTNLVFLVDVSGSMRSANKLPLVKTALKMLLEELGPRDRISLVVYAGASGVVLEPTAGDQRETISAALDRLEAGGSTNGGAGINLAYAMARQGWIEGGVNRVLLATDGDFNVGTTGFQTLVDLVETKRRSGVALTTLGFGAGNYNDHLMEQLADAGDGNHAYIDSVQEAHKVLVRQREATLRTIARDVKIQIEFNPSTVSEYRLIGYENRALKNEDFSNDAVDAGDIGAGHTVTALYEISLAGSGGDRHQALRYGKAEPESGAGLQSELAHLRLRYKLPEDGAKASSHLIERPIARNQVGPSFAEASQSLKLAASVAAFGQKLSGGVYVNGFDYTDIAGLTDELKHDPFGDLAGFRQLVQVAGSLSRQAHHSSDGVSEIGG